MTVAPAIEMGTGRGAGAGPGPGSGSGLGLLQARTSVGTPLAGLVSGSARLPSSLPASAAGSGAASFRSNWRAQLASLGGAIEGLSPESREGGPDAAEASGGEAAGNWASPTGPLISSLAAQIERASTQTVHSAVLPALTAGNSRAPFLAGRTGAPVQADTPVLPTAATTPSGEASSSAEAANPAHKTKSTDEQPPPRAGSPFEAISTPPPGIVAAAVLASQSATPVAMDGSPASRFAVVAAQAAQAGDSSPVPIRSATTGAGVRASDSSLPTRTAPGSGTASAASGPESSTEAAASAEPANLEGRGTQPSGPAPALGTTPFPGPETPEGMGGVPDAREVIGPQVGARNELEQRQAGARPAADRMTASLTEGAQAGAPGPGASSELSAGQRTARVFPDVGTASPAPLPVAGHGAVGPSRLVPEIKVGGNELGLEHPARSSAGAVSLQGAQRTAHGAATDNKSEHRLVSAAAQAAGVQGDTSGLLRDPGTARLPTGSSDEARETASSVPLRETFAALDSGSAPGAPAWTHAGARQAEAGFQDPALGWVGVRAEMSGGGVHASLVPGSAEAAQELGRQMDGLHTYLAAQHTPVESLGLATPGGRDGGFQGNEGGNQQTQQNMQQGAGQGSGQGTFADAQPGSSQGGMGIDGPVAAESSAAAMGGDRGAFMDGSVGNHISLMA